MSWASLTFELSVRAAEVGFFCLSWVVLSESSHCATTAFLFIYSLSAVTAASEWCVRPLETRDAGLCPDERPEAVPGEV